MILKIEALKRHSGRITALAQIGPHPIDKIMFSRLEAAEHEKKTEKPKESKAEG